MLKVKACWGLEGKHHSHSVRETASHVRAGRTRQNLRAKVTEKSSDVLSSFVIALNHILYLEWEPKLGISTERLKVLYYEKLERLREAEGTGK